MMKTIPSFVMLLFFCVSAVAQKVTHADLIGKWELALVEDRGAILDFDAKKVTFTQEKIDAMTAEELEIEEKVTLNTLNAMAMTIEFIDDTNIRFSLPSTGSVKTSTYILEERDGRQFIVSEPTGKAALQALPGMLEVREKAGNGIVVMQFKKKP